MIGFVVTPEVASQAEVSLKVAFSSRKMQPYFTLGAMEILSGEQAGMMFIPFDDSALDVIRYRNFKLPDFPEYQEVIGYLGGLDARVEIDPSCLIDPEQQYE
jgi:hypothetical protein